MITDPAKEQPEVMADICAGSDALFDLSARAKFRMTGPDRLRFLNGQITNDARKAGETNAIEACVLSAKGKTNAHLFLSATDDAFVLDADSELRESLLVRLERYLIADAVEIADVTDKFGILHVVGLNRPNLPNEMKMVRVRRFATEGWDIWVNVQDHESMRQKLSAQFPLYDESRAEIVRIESGIPRWGRELTEEIIPIEANLEERCIDYEKGCYIGQEVISRIKMSGQTNKRLCGLVSLEDAPLAVGARLRPEGEDRDVGWITSAIRSTRRNKEIALGFVKRGYNRDGNELVLSSGEGISQPTRIKVVPLPFTMIDPR